MKYTSLWKEEGVQLNLRTPPFLPQNEERSRMVKEREEGTMWEWKVAVQSQRGLNPFCLLQSLSFMEWTDHHGTERWPRTHPSRKRLERRKTQEDRVPHLGGPIQSVVTGCVTSFGNSWRYLQEDFRKKKFELHFPFVERRRSHLLPPFYTLV